MSTMKTKPTKKPRPVKPRRMWLDEESVEALRHKMAKAFNGSYDGHLHKDDLTAMLRAIGIVAKGGGK